MGQDQVSDQSRTSWYPVITASSYKVTVLPGFSKTPMGESEKLIQLNVVLSWWFGGEAITMLVMLVVWRRGDNNADGAGGLA